MQNFRNGKKTKWSQAFFPSLHTRKKHVLNGRPPQKKMRKEEDESVFDILGSQSSYTIPCSGTLASPPLSPSSPSMTSQSFIVSPSKCLLSPSSREVAPPATAGAEVAVDVTVTESALAKCTASDVPAAVVNSDAVDNVSAVGSDAATDTADTASAGTIYHIGIYDDVVGKPVTAREIASSLSDLLDAIDVCPELDGGYIRPRLKTSIYRSHHRLEKYIREQVTKIVFHESVNP